MTPIDAEILHIVARDTPSERLETLLALRARRDLARRQRVVQFGSAPQLAPKLRDMQRLLTPVGFGWLAGRSLGRLLPRDGRAILHVWSGRALGWCLAQLQAALRTDRNPVAPAPTVVVDAEVTLDLRRLSAALTCASAVPVHAICPTLVARQRAIAAGVAPQRLTVIRDSVEFAALRPEQRRRIRSELALGEGESAVLMLAPLRRGTGGLYGVWATLLLHQLRPTVRLVVPGGGREVQRLAYLVRTARHGHMARYPGTRWSLCELLIATDLAVYVPAGQAPVSTLAWAMAAARPIVASAVPATTELLVHGQNAWLARPNDPRDICRRLLEALESPEQSWRQAEQARTQAFGLFSRQRMLEQYRTAYANALAGRPLDTDIVDPALV